MSGSRTVWWVALWSCLLLAPEAWAQGSTSGTIAGVVRDSSGAVLPGVTVGAASPALIERTRTVVTDADGQYKIVDLRPGTYEVTFTLSGFKTVKREGIELTTGFTATVNAELGVGAVEETITVSGAAPVVDVQNTRTQEVFKSEFLDAIANTKTLGTFTNLIPGVTESSRNVRDVGGTSGDPPIGQTIHGSDSGMISIDGMKVITMYNASVRRVNPNTTAIQEIVYETGNGSAEAWSGGVNVNVISKDGGNTFSGTLFGGGTGKGLDTNNLDDALRARGLNNYNQQKDLYDLAGGLGAPLVKDKLWFYATARVWGNDYYLAGNYYNLTPHTLFYTPDRSRQATFGRRLWEASGRVTWQASVKDRLVFQTNNSSECFCPIGPDSGTTSPEGGWEFHFAPQNLYRTEWTRAQSSRLLLQLAGAYRRDLARSLPNAGVLPTDISVTDTALGIRYGSNFSGPAGSWEPDYGEKPEYQIVTQGSASYTTGSHAFKAGFSTLTGRQTSAANPNFPYQYVFTNQKPVGINELVTPWKQESNSLLLGLFAQDQWTLRRLTLNLGVRFDRISDSSPAQTTPGGMFLPPTSFPEAGGIPNWNSVHPRLGAAYDLFGAGRTALKVSFGTYDVVSAYDLTLTHLLAPPGLLVAQTTRAWNDTNGNFVPDCVLTNPAANGECGKLSNTLFGTSVVGTRYAPDVISGWNKAPYLAETQASVQQQIGQKASVTAGYFRTSYGNKTITQNLNVIAADFSPYCVTAPVDSRLPGGGGYQICGLYDVNPNKFGSVNNLVTFASNFGGDSTIFDGFDALVNAHFGQGGFLYGGLSTGRLENRLCATADVQFQPISGIFTGPGVPTQNCDNVRSWSANTEVKLSGVYPLPWQGLQLSAVYQNLPGIARNVTQFVPNSQIAPSLGRNLSSCPAQTGACSAGVTIQLAPQNTLFEPRQNQTDIRASKIWKIGARRLQANVEVFNIFNANDVLTNVNAYGPNWLRPFGIIPGRLYRLGAQFSF